MTRQIKSALLQLVLLTIITVPAILPLLHSGYFSMHDDQHIARLYLLHQGIAEGNLYPRWVDMLGFGFGYPLFNFYPPLIYYVAELFHIIGFSLIWSIKLMLITGFVTGAVGMYYLSKPYIGKAAGLLASVLYTYFTYHAVVIYVRGAFAEFFAMALLPFLCACIFRLQRESGVKNALWFGIMLALVILCHPLIAIPSILMLAILFLLLLITSINRYMFTIKTMLGGIIGLGLSAFFWLPSLVEKKYTLVDSILTKELASYNIHFVNPAQFWYSPWGYGGSGMGLSDGMSFQLGKIHIGLVLISLILSILYIYAVRAKKLPWGEKFPAINFFYVILVLFILSLFLATNYSAFVWNQIQFLSYLQFPWRFLTFSAVFISICGAFGVYFITHIFQKLNTKIILFGITLLLSILTIVQYQKYFAPQRYINTTDASRTTFEEIAWRVSRTSYEFVPKGVKSTKSELETTILDISRIDIPMVPFVNNNFFDVKTIKNEFAKKWFVVNTKKAGEFQLNTFNFPGWHAYINGRQVNIKDNNKYKLITVNIPPGENSLQFYFDDTRARKIGNITSGAIFLLITTWLLYSYYLTTSKK